MSDNNLYQLKLKHAKRLIDVHNYLRKPTLNDNRVVFEDFVSHLVQIGGINNEMLLQVRTADLQWPCGLPVLMARRLVEIFGINDSEVLSNPDPSKVVSLISEGVANGTL